MVFESKTVLNPDNLPETAVYRLAEVEINFLLANLTNLQTVLSGQEHAHPRAVAQLLDMLFQQDDPEREEFKTALLHQKNKTSTAEHLHLLLYSGYSIRAASTAVNVVTQTAQRYKEKYPNYFPIYRGWNKKLLLRYSAIRLCFNVHGEAQKLLPILRHDEESYKTAEIFQKSKIARQKREAFEDTNFETYEELNSDVPVWE